MDIILWQDFLTNKIQISIQFKKQIKIRFNRMRKQKLEHKKKASSKERRKKNRDQFLSIEATWKSSSKHQRCFVSLDGIFCNIFCCAEENLRKAKVANYRCLWSCLYVLCAFIKEMNTNREEETGGKTIVKIVEFSVVKKEIESGQKCHKTTQNKIADWFHMRENFKATRSRFFFIVFLYITTQKLFIQE